MTAQIPDLPGFEKLLLDMLQPDTAVVRQAETALNDYLRYPKTIEVLFQLLGGSPNPAIRQLAAVLMRKRIVGHWANLNDQAQTLIRSTLLDLLVKDQSHPVRRSIGDLISVIARVSIPVGQWKELLQFLFQCTQSENPEYREVALSVFEMLTETIGSHLRGNFPVLKNIFSQGLQDPHPSVRVAALKAVGSLVKWISGDQEVALFKELSPLMMKVIVSCIEQGNDDEAIQAFETFDDLLEAPSASINGLVPDIVKFCLQIGTNTKIDFNVRQHAVTVIQWTIQYRKKTLVKQKLFPEILGVAFSLCAEPDTDADSDDITNDIEDLEELTAHKYGAQLIDLLALNVKPKYIYKPALQYIATFSTHEQPSVRRAGLVGLGVIAEGCSEEMKNQESLQQLLPVIYRGLADPDMNVREAACIALGQFGKYLQPEIIAHYQTVLPYLFKSLEDATLKVRMGSCYALESFCENLGTEIIPYLEPLLKKLVELLQAPKPEIQEIAISAITSAAAAAESALQPYCKDLLELMKRFIVPTAEVDMVVRCRATECIGHIAKCMGTAFQPALEEYMAYVIEGCALEYNELREYSYGFFSHMAEIFKADFGRFLPTIMPLLLASCESSEGITTVAPQPGGPGEGIEADDDDEALDLSIRTAFLDEKAAAVYAIGIFAENVGQALFPYLDKIVPSFLELIHYFHENVRATVVSSVRRIGMPLNFISNIQAQCLNVHFPPKAPWQKGVSSNENPLAPQTVQFLTVFIPLIFQQIAEDDDKQVCNSAFEDLNLMISTIGPGVVEPYLPAAIAMVIKVLQKGTTCQSIREDEEAVADDAEDDEDDQFLIDAACDCIIEMVKVFGVLLEPYLQALCPPLFHLTKSPNEVYRSDAVGTLAELTANIGPAVAVYVSQLMPVALAGMKDTDPETRSNSVFFVGVLLQNAGMGGTQYYAQVLQNLANLFQDPSGLPNLTDNCCGCVARMILTSVNSVPVAQVLPVLLKNVPLKKDFAENKSVYPCLFQLISTSNPAIASNMSLLFSAFANSLGNSNVEMEFQQQIVSTAKGLLQQYPNEIQQVLGSLPQDQQENLKKFLQ